MVQISDQGLETSATVVTQVPQLLLCLPDWLFLPPLILWLRAYAHVLFLVPCACHFHVVCHDLSLLSNPVTFQLPWAMASCSTWPC